VKVGFATLRFVTEHGGDLVIKEGKEGELTLVGILCPNHNPQCPNERGGLCQYSGTYGPHGCELPRGPWCYGDWSSELEPCDCPRCTDGSGCGSWDGGGWFHSDESPLERNCGTCSLANSYGKYGCAACKD